jgi:cytochrome P450
MKTVKLSDGTILPEGTQFCMPAQAIQNAPSNTPNPEEFDGFRYYRYRQNAAESQLHQFLTTAPDVLNFGYGKDACPGRFFATLAIKALLVKFLMDYDIKLPHGQGRPKNMSAYEYIFPDPEGALMFRERKSV